MIIKTAKIEENPKPARSAKPDRKEVSEIAADIASIPKNPKNSKSKKLVSIRYDTEIIDYFEATGIGWQTRINAVLLDYIRRNSGGQK